MKLFIRPTSFALGMLLLAGSGLAQAQTRATILDFIPASASVNFTLSASLHTVHGAFQFKSGSINFDPTSGKLSGDIVVDATSGDTANSSRDHKMHKDVLESARYPDIIFRPDHVAGPVAPYGASTVQVHGVFSMHGADHDFTVPVQVEMAPGKWTIAAKIVVPYVQWGMKNPSNFLLHVPDSVEVEIHASGTLPSPAAH